jgi:hypothetical protein
VIPFLCAMLMKCLAPSPAAPLSPAMSPALPRWVWPSFCHLLLPLALLFLPLAPCRGCGGGWGARGIPRRLAPSPSPVGTCFCASALPHPFLFPFSFFLSPSFPLSSHPPPSRASGGNDTFPAAFPPFPARVAATPSAAGSGNTAFPLFSTPPQSPPAQ